MKVNIAITGGSCTGKSTMAAALFAALKERGSDYDLITEESRKLREEFGECRTPFDRFYFWRQQEREELRSGATDGFITDAPLFDLYVKARQYATEPRDNLAVREFFRMCLEIKDRYQLIVIADNPLEIPYKTDQSRVGSEERSRERHALIRSFVEHFWPDKIFFVKGSVAERVASVLSRLEKLRMPKNGLIISQY